jgi:O-antigen/teichoic acid export membrane protein
MKLNYKEDPKEWRRSVLLTALGLAVISSVLCWRRHLPLNVWLDLLAGLGLIAVCAVLQPRWFRGYYRVSLRLGFYSSQFIGRCVLFLFFIFIMTPLGWGLRLAGKDLLRLKRPRNAATHWQTAKDYSPLDRLF